MPRTLEHAKEIVDKAIEFNVHPAWEDPNSVTDTLIQQRADEIVDLVVKTAAGGSTNDVLLEMVNICHVDPQSDVTREAYARKFGQQPETAPSNGHSTSPPPAPSEAQDASPEEQASSASVGSPEPAKEAALGGGEVNPVAAEEKIQTILAGIDDIFPGYDDQKVADITRAILESAASGDLTPEEWERIKTYEAAHQARPEILGLVPVFKVPEPPAPEPVSPDSPGVRTPEIATWHERPDGATEYRVPTGYQPDATQEAPGEAGVEDLYNGKTQTRAQQENLAIPGTPDGQPPMLPIDITTTGDAELSQLATAFHNHFARAQWLLSQEDARERVAEHLEREAERDAFVAAYALHKDNIPEGKEQQPTSLEAARRQAEHDAEIAAPVRKWRGRKISHAVEGRELKALAAIFDKAVWRINEELERRARLQTTRPTS